MFLEIGIILLALWLLGFLLFPLDGLIHIILVIAVIVIILNFVSGRRINSR